MFKNYLITAWRNIIKDKAYTAINILGLATGMAVALIIGLWVNYQFSYDRFLPGYLQVYQAEYRSNQNGEIQTQQPVSLLLAGVLKSDIPEIKYVTQTDWMGEHGLVVGDKKLYIAGAHAGEDFLKIFKYPLLQGNAGTVLREPNSIVLTKSTAFALFGKADPLNKIVRVDNLYNLKVSGILDDIPGNSTLKFNYIIPFSFYVQTEEWVKYASTDWTNNSFQTFVQLQPGVTYAQVEPKLKAIMPKYKPDWVKAIKAEVFMHPMKDWHLYSEFKNGVENGGFIDYVKMFGIIGILVLLIACINFTNLSTTRSERRAREVGVRKAVGSLRKDLIYQFLIESVVVTFAAFLFSLLFVQLALPAFNLLTKDTISIPWGNSIFWAIMIGYTLLTGLLAGSRPAFYLSSFQPVKVLKGALQAGKGSTLPRKILVVLQFSCSVALIISTIIVYQQIQYAKDRPIGYNANKLMMTDGSSDVDRNYAALKHDMLQTGLVTSVTKASTTVTYLNSWRGIDDWQGKYPNEVLNVATIAINDDYFKTVGMQLKMGSDFAGIVGADSLNVLLNEAAVKRFRFKSPLNQVITWNNGQQRMRVIGVVKDALMMSPFLPAQPTFFIYKPEWTYNVLYRLSPTANTHNAIAKLSVLFNKYNPSYPYIYHFADESYATKFDLEVLIGKLAGIFSALAIFISCLGLFGLAAYVAQQRTKEIGIRKVLGASVPQLWMLLSKDFIILVLLSCVIASPVAWYFLNGWLLKYDYRISIGPSVFIWAAVMALVITIITISFQAIKAAVANPTKSLRSE